MPNIEDACPTWTKPERDQLLDQQILEYTKEHVIRSVSVAPPTHIERIQNLIENLTRISGVQQRLDVLLHTLLRAVPAAQQGTLYLCTADRHSFVVGAASPNSPNLVGWEIHAEGGYIDAVAHVQYPVLIADNKKEGLLAYPAQSHPACCALAVPFVVGGRTVGVLALENCERTGIFAEKDLDTLSLLAEQTAFVVDHSRLLTATSVHLADHNSQVDLWREMAEEIPASLLLVSPRRRKLWANRAFYALAGHTRDELQDQWDEVSSLLSTSVAELCQQQRDPTHLTLACKQMPSKPILAICQQLDSNRIHGSDS